MNHFLPVPLLGGYEHASRMLVLTYIILAQLPNKMYNKPHIPEMIVSTFV